MSESETPKTLPQTKRLISIMKHLRDPHSGCEWDLAQNFRTIAPYAIEEAYEVADAIERNDMENLKEELGDLLLQVVFHSRMAEEQGHFEFEHVAETISDKMESRHPHIFGGQSVTMNENFWERIKAKEREDLGKTSMMDGVAAALPALMRAQKLQKRASIAGFDWKDIKGPTAKVHEEIGELSAACDNMEKFEEAGDFLFAAVNLVRAYGIDAEEALRSANIKFEKRFRGMEDLTDIKLADLSTSEKELLWERVKASTKDHN